MAGAKHAKGSQSGRSGREYWRVSREKGGAAGHVENAETAHILITMGVDYGQGWHFGRPQRVYPKAGVMKDKMFEAKRIPVV